MLCCPLISIIMMKQLPILSLYLVEKEDIVLSYDGLLNSCLQIIKQAEQLPAHQQWEKFPQQVR